MGHRRGLAFAALVVASLLIATACGSLFRQTAIIDWVHFIRLDDRTYVMSQTSADINLVDESQLGREYARVNFDVSEVDFVGYRVRNGDAAYLPAGTPIYEVSGYSPSHMLGVRGDAFGGKYATNQIVLYEIQNAPDAKSGGDLLPLEGRGVSIDLSDFEFRNQVLKSLSAEEVRIVVDGILEASLSEQGVDSSNSFVLTFRLEGGIALQRVYDGDHGVLQGGIMLPEPARRNLEAAFQP